MQVTTAVKHLVLAKLQDGLDRAEKKYGRKFVMPRVVYEVRGRTAGTASYTKNTIDLNSVLLMENVAEFIARTVPHELAHIIDHILHPENFDRGIEMTRRGYKRVKRDIHGPDWQAVCYVLGMTDIARCHQYDTSSAREATGKGAYRYQCQYCSKVYVLSSVKHNKLLRNTRAYTCKCRGMLNLILEGPVVSKPEVESTPAARAAIVTAPPAGNATKLDKCWHIYKSYSNVGRGGLIAMFVSQADCTTAGAGTYYALCKKRFESGVL